MAACCTGPGYATPRDAIQQGPREKVVFLPCITPDDTRPDYLATVDVDPTSKTYSQVIHRLHVPYNECELHHTGWNACAGCFANPTAVRNRLILPSLTTDRIYVVDTTNNRAPEFYRICEPETLHSLGLRMPHTVHCLRDGNIMISTLGNLAGEPQGSFAVLDGKTFQPLKRWSEDTVQFGYDFWYQYKINRLVSTEWSCPNILFRGFHMEDVQNGAYGKSLHIWDTDTKKHIQTIDMGDDGIMPLETRFMHDPEKKEGFVGCALSSTVFRFYQKDDKTFGADKVIAIPAKKVSGWAMDFMPSLITDILISMDDRFLYFSNWFHGDIRQYDITDTKNPRLVGQVFIGGLITRGGPVKVLEDPENQKQPEALYVKGKKVEGAAQMIQLSLDGKRLYVTTSLFKAYDKQFYPDMCKNGSMLLQIDVDTVKGGLKVNKNFCVDFGAEPDGPVLAHEVRYPGGDCTSDIYLPKEMRPVPKL